MREIGSNFCENIYLDSNDNLSLINNNIGNKNIYYFKSGRNAIKYISDLYYKKGKKVLLPAYTCSTVIDPFVESGWIISYFDINERFSIDVKQFVDMIDREKPDLILFHSYFGFDTSSEIYNILKDAQDKGIIIIEDLTQSLLSSFNKFNADYYVSSLRKYFCITDGGFLISREKIDVFYSEHDLLLENLSLEAFKLKNEYINGYTDDKESFRNLYKQVNYRFTINNKIYSISPSSIEMLKKIDFDYIKSKRRENFKYLSQKLCDLALAISTPLNKLTKDEVPLYFVIILQNKEKRDALQNYMASKNIFCPIIWPRPNEIVDTKLVSYTLYDKILCIPCDQRYSIDDMRIVVEYLKKGIDNL